MWCGASKILQVLQVQAIHNDIIFPTTWRGDVNTMFHNNNDMLAMMPHRNVRNILRTTVINAV